MSCSPVAPPRATLLIQDIDDLEKEQPEINPPKTPKDAFEQTHCYLFPPRFRNGLTLCPQSGTMYLGHNTDRPERFVNVVTTPKSGTHMLLKILKLLGVDHKYKSMNMAYAPHICHYADFLPYRFLSAEYMRSTFDLKEKYIVTIRDPKDFLISYLQWIDKEMDQGMIPHEEAWKEATISERLDQLLAGGDHIKLESLKPAPWYIGNYLVAARLMDMNPPHVLFLKFEDLIGPEMGGSSKHDQVEAYKKLCDFTGVRYTRPKINQLVRLLPGNTLTYIPQKKVGRWKEYFTDQNKRHYNTRFKAIEQILGYPFETEVADIEVADIPETEEEIKAS